MNRTAGEAAVWSMPKLKVGRVSHATLLSDDTLRAVASCGIYVTAPMLGVCKQWRRVASEFPRVTLDDLRNPSWVVYKRHFFYKDLVKRGMREPTLQYYNNLHRVTTTTERLLELILHMSRTTFSKFAIRPVRKNDHFAIYEVACALKVTMFHTDGVWGILKRRWRAERGMRNSIVIKGSAKRDQAIRHVQHQFFTPGSDLYELIPSAKMEILKIVSLYTGTD